MFKATSRQKTLFEIDSRLPDSIKRRLKGSWAEGFAKKVLPVLLAAEDEFSVLYREDNGRPNWSIARMLGISILKEMQNMSDQQALDCLSFDIRWQHALGIEPEEAYLSRRSILDFRSRMALVDPEMKMLRSVFNKVGDAAINDLKISTKEQRLDSTIITSNISTFGRLDLFKKTLTNFLNWLKKEHPSKIRNLSKSMRNWSRKNDDIGWFGSVAKLKQPKKQALLSTMAGWLYEIEVMFTSDKSINAEEPYLLVKRLINEHCELETDDKNDKDDDDDNDDESNNTSGETNGVDKIELRKKVNNPSTSMQSPHDPDAGYSGHKGSGYFAHVTETCNNDTSEIITDYFVEPAGTDTDKDQIATKNLEASGKQPEILYEDGGYPTAGGMLDAKEKGTQIIAPISTKGNQPKDAICRDQFKFDQDGNCTACPEGHAPLRHGMRTSSSKTNKALHAVFDGAKCADCRLKGRCMTRPANNGQGKTYHIEIDPTLIERDRSRAGQDEEWWNRYRIRSGIEATMSELKRVNGIDRLRVRRITRVTMAVSFKVIACNAKRWIIASEKCEKRGLTPNGPARQLLLSLFMLQKTPDQFLSGSNLKTLPRTILTVITVEFF